MNNLTELDNPAWTALQSIHKPFSSGTLNIQRYATDKLPFMACKDAAIADLDEFIPYVSKDEKLFILGDLPELSPRWQLLMQLDCVQMVCTKPIAVSIKKNADILKLQDQDHDELITLINKVQPGYFKRGTPLLGDYFGIRIDGQLIAVAGERMRMPGLSEVSAVCTDPAFSGRGFAQLLISHLCHKIQSEGSMPFLHAVNTNKRAIGVYELLGFQNRRDITFWQVGLSQWS